jgi:hypothetical protein
MRARALAEDLENEAGTVDHLGLPAPFEVALLHRAERRIDDHQPDVVFGDQVAEDLDIAAAEKCPGGRSGNPNDLGANHIEVDGLGKADSFREAPLG